MGMTMTQKILAAHAGLAEVSAGQLIEADLDLVMGNDITAPVAIRELDKIHKKGVFDKDKVVLVPDHFSPAKDIKSAENCLCLRQFAKKNDITNYFEVGQMGIEHALLPEKGLVTAGDCVIGADSHTCTYGALGAFSTGVGSTDMAAGMATGKCWFKVPSAIRFNLTGKLPRWVSGKDVILYIIGKIGVDGALYQSMEFTGDGVASLSMDDRFTICNMDSVPIIAITANVATTLLGKDTFQEIDINGVTLPITKHNYIVKKVEDLAPVIRRAFEIVKTGRPGPVLIDITKDVTANVTEFTPKKPATILRVTKKIRGEDVENAVKMIEEAKRPFIMVGGGAVISGAEKELKAFAEKVDAPVCDTLMGKGAFDGRDPRYTGMIGMHGTKASNLGVSKADLLITVGARFSDRVTGNTTTFAKNAKVLQFDVDSAEIDKNIMTAGSVCGDVKIVLGLMNEKIADQHHPEWMQDVAEMKQKFPLVYDKSVLTGPGIVQKIYELTGGNAIITTEVGQHQMWAAQFYKYRRPRQLLTSGGLGTMGYGLGAAIGAKVGCPDDVVVNIAGDGCFRMNMNELATASRYDLPVIEVIVDNHVLGMVRQWQTLFYGKRYSSTILRDKVDYVKVSEGLGAVAMHCTTNEEFEAAFRKALEIKNAPVVLDCVIDEDEKVWPMVSPGGAISEAFNEEDLKRREAQK